MGKSLNRHETYPLQSSIQLLRWILKFIRCFHEGMFSLPLCCSNLLGRRQSRPTSIKTLEIFLLELDVPDSLRERAMSDVSLDLIDPFCENEHVFGHKIFAGRWLALAFLHYPSVGCIHVWVPSSK
jgi:hypothetical protein